MGFGTGWNGGGTVGQLAGQTVSATSYTSTAASGADGFKVATNGARFHIGTGASDYFDSDGSIITAHVGLNATGDMNATGTGALNASAFPVYGRVADGATAIGVKVGNANGLSTAGSSIATFYADNFSTARASVQATGAFNPDFTDDSATPGARTVNKPSGLNAIAAGASTCVITNSVVKATSIVLCQLQFVDATATFIKAVIPAANSFTITVNANATAATKFAWIVFNGN